MADLPLVSVLMTCYNREKYIGQAIESVLHSTVKDFELVIVDDGSTDRTVEIVKEYAAIDQRIRWYVNEKNLGDYPNRNRAASLATGKYIKYVDSDDAIYPHGLEIMVNSMELYPDAALGMSSMSQNHSRPFPFCLLPAEAYRYHFFGPRLFHKGPLDAIIKRKAFNEAGGFLPGRMISDTDMWHRMALHYPVVLMSEGIVWQRRHADQELTAANDFIVEKEKIKWRYLDNSSCPLSTGEISRIRKIQLKTFTRFCLAKLARFKFTEAIVYGKCWWLVFNMNIKPRINQG